MDDWSFSDRDLAQVDALGITAAQLRLQIEIFRKSSFHMRLKRPATVGDGIQRVLPGEMQRFMELQEKAASEGRFTKFVPASGAATRMFQVLAHFYHQGGSVAVRELRERAAAGDQNAGQLLHFLDSLPRFAFCDDLRSVMARVGLELEKLQEQGSYHDILHILLTTEGLGYGSLPKGLIKFHRYLNGSRTAMEEHLVEAAATARAKDGLCRLHFTVSEEHLEAFRRRLEEVRAEYEKRYEAFYEVGFSLQKPSTNTLAVTLDNQPFRDSDGRLLFRPGGHGALLENLNDLRGDLVYIKNIDNVVPDWLKPTTILWKKVLGGYLVEVLEQRNRHLERLRRESEESAPIAAAATFAAGSLHVALPPGFDQWPHAERRAFLIERLNRPLRVCGMVENVQEPGGGPFWVQGRDGRLTLQIVESAQVDCKSPEQEAIWRSTTHFNPVDLVCAVRDPGGNPYDLRAFVDPHAVFIARKSKDGRELKALELPGLWNGAMSDWITLFVEVPRLTFHPVKTVNALLNPEHQPL